MVENTVMSWYVRAAKKLVKGIKISSAYRSKSKDKKISTSLLISL